MKSERIAIVPQPNFFEHKTLKSLESMTPERFAVTLDSKNLFIQLGGAAWDSFYSLNDKSKSESFLKILKSEAWTKNRIGMEPIKPEKQIAIVVAFLVESNGISYDDHEDFIEFCHEHEIFVSKKQIEKTVKKIRKNNKNR